MHDDLLSTTAIPSIVHTRTDCTIRPAIIYDLDWPKSDTEAYYNGTEDDPPAILRWEKCPQCGATSGRTRIEAPRMPACPCCGRSNALMFEDGRAFCRHCMAFVTAAKLVKEAARLQPEWDRHWAEVVRIDSLPWAQASGF